MSRFIRKLLIFFFAYVIAAALFFLIVPAQYTTTYNAGILDKMDRLENTESPKIILAANSNLAFGMNSEELEKAMGMPVVNLGLHGGLGNKFHERMASSNIGKGDILVICHTDFGDDGKMYAPDLLWFTIEDHYEVWDIPGIGGLLENAFNLPQYMIKATRLYFTGKGNDPNLAETTQYARSNFNKYGDIISEAHKESDETRRPNMVSIPRISDTCINRLNRLNKYCEQQGATMVVAGFPIPDMDDRPSDEEYNAFQKELSDKLDCDVISDYTDYIYDPKYFNGLIYHLTDKGAELRTKQLIEDLETWKQSN